MRAAFHPEASLEFRESVAFYENRRAGLGVAFASEIGSAFSRIIEAPERWPLWANEVRRCLARRFPYAILYSVEKDFILIIAIMHGSRKPGYWRDRKTTD